MEQVEGYNSNEFDNMTEEEMDEYIAAMEYHYAPHIVEKSWPFRDFLLKFRHFKHVTFSVGFYSVSEELEKAIFLYDNEERCTVLYNLCDYTRNEIMQHQDEYIVELRKSGHFILCHTQMQICPNVSLVKENGKLGCKDDTGKILIPIKYDSISCVYCGEEKLLLCGRDGTLYTGYISRSFLSSDKSFDTLYTGEYDLYDTKGKLLIGGFIDYKYLAENDLFLFKYGHNYTIYEGDGTLKSPYIYAFPSGKWILISSSFCFIKAYSYMQDDSYSWITENNTCVIGSIFKGKNDILEGNVNSNNKIGHKISIKDVLYSEIQVINKTTILLCNKGYYNIIFGRFYVSPKFEWIDVIDESYAFVYDKGQIGLFKSGRTAIPCNYSYITNPIDGWCFAAIKYPYIPDSKTWRKYYVILCNVEKERYDCIRHEDIIVAIDNISQEVLEEMLADGGLLLYKTNPEKQLSSYSLSYQYKSYFRPNFLKLLNPSNYNGRFDPKCYWVSAAGYKMELRQKNKISCFSDSYTLMDALDGDPSAYWNID